MVKYELDELLTLEQGPYCQSCIFRSNEINHSISIGRYYYHGHLSQWVNMSAIFVQTSSALLVIIPDITETAQTSSFHDGAKCKIT